MKHLALCLLFAFCAVAFVSDAAPAAEAAANAAQAEIAARRAARADFLARLDTLKPTRFFLLDPAASKRGDKGEKFHDYLITAEADPGSQAAAEGVTQSLRDLLAHPSNAVFACFEPHHGVRLSDGKSTYELVICFGCAQYYLYDSTGKVVLGSSFDLEDEEPKWDAAFAASGLARRGVIPGAR